MTQSSHNLRVWPANPLYLPPPRHLCSGPLTALPAPTPPPCFSRLGSAVRMETDDLRGASTLAFHVPALPPPGHVFRFFSLPCMVSSAPWPSCLSLHFSSGTFPGVGVGKKSLPFQLGQSTLCWQDRSLLALGTVAIVCLYADLDNGDSD